MLSFLAETPAFTQTHVFSTTCTSVRVATGTGLAAQHLTGFAFSFGVDFLPFLLADALPSFFLEPLLTTSTGLLISRLAGRTVGHVALLAVTLVVQSQSLWTHTLSFLHFCLRVQALIAFILVTGFTGGTSIHIAIGADTLRVRLFIVRPPTVALPINDIRPKIIYTFDTLFFRVC